MGAGFGVYKGFVVIVKRGCGGLGRSKVKILILSVNCDDIFCVVKVFRDFLKSERRV